MWALWVLMSCGAPAPECVSTAECGDAQACLADRCVDVECRASAECAIESRCSPETYTCEPGCASSDDCYIGDRCDVAVGACVPRECRDTQSDCAFGERCDPASGACRKDPDPHCEVCRDDFDCGPGVCLQLSGDRYRRCILPCSPEAYDPCPAGLQCSAQVSIDGELEGFICIGLCNGL